MGERVDQLLAVTTRKTNGQPSAAELLDMQLKAASERLAEKRVTLPVLNRRAADTGISQIREPADLVPLLFAHSIYKSYPESFVVDGRWDRMSNWLDTITTCAVTGVDVTDVADADEWIARLRVGGIHVLVSSGTTGKHSFFPVNEHDIAFTSARVTAQPLTQRPVTFLGPSRAPMRIAYSFRAAAEAYGRPGAIHSLEGPMRVADQIRAAAVRRKMVDGTALPSDVSALQAEAAAAATAREQELTDLLQKVVGHRREPQKINGQWPMLWRLMLAAREAGLGPGSFHPETVITLSGGLKGATLPDGFDQELREYFHPVVLQVGYGMSELSGGFPSCEEGVYHCPGWILPLVVDESGENLLDAGPGGWVRGRFAAYDPAWESVWGGVVSGDELTVDFNECPCGRPGPTIGPDIVRYSEASAAGDDKLTCGGTIEAYIRGMVPE